MLRKILAFMEAARPAAEKIAWFLSGALFGVGLASR